MRPGGKRMQTRISIGRRIHAPAAVVWHLLVDTRAWTLWGPSIRAVAADNVTIHAATRGRIQIRSGIWLPFEITQWVPGRYWSWKVGGIKATGHRVIPVDARSCCLCFDVPIWAAPYMVICLWAVKRIKRLASDFQLYAVSNG